MYLVHVISDCVTSYDLKKIDEMLEYYEKKDVMLSNWISLFRIDELPVSKKRTNKAKKCREEDNDIVELISIIMREGIEG